MAQMDDKAMLSVVITREQVEQFDDITLLREKCMQLSEQVTQCYGQITSALEEAEIARGETNAVGQQCENLSTENAALQAEYNALRGKLRSQMQAHNRVKTPSGEIAQLQEEMHKKQIEFEKMRRAHSLLQRQQLIDQEQIALLQEQLQGVDIKDSEGDNRSTHSAIEEMHMRSPIASVGR
uniref:Uncharacterized protein n=1 Tax=Plectus sambesii TaxID=2011161 RepID=A0A914VG06_9BILA